MSSISNEMISGRRLSRLPKTRYSGLDFDNIIEDITALVTENPEYNSEWEDFLSSNAGRMLVELFAYISDQLATRIDWVVNESFIGTATQRNSVIRLLKLIGYNLSLPTAASVPVTLILDRPVGQKLLSGNYNFSSGELDLFSLSAVDRSGAQRKNFELIEYDEQTNRYEYKNQVVIDSGTLENPQLRHSITLHEGKTFVEEQTVSISNNYSFVLQQSPVIENSIRVFRVGSTNDIELLRVESFLDPRAQRETDAFGETNEIPFLLSVLEGNRVSIEFGPTSLLPDSSRRPEVDSRIRVFYRVGGGADGNIVRRSINTSRRERGAAGILDWNADVNVQYINSLPGTGGREGEDPEYAAIFGPLQIRTAQKAVTEEDYDILLSTDNTIIKNKSYGNNNLPPNLRNLYGVSIRPLEVWNYVLQDKPGWRTTPPSRYNDLEWISLRLQNRFNEKHAFTDGRFNSEVSLNTGALQSSGTVDWRDGDTMYARNFIVVPSLFVDRDGNNIIRNNGSFNKLFRVKLTSKILSDSFFTLADENNFFSLNYELNNNAVVAYNENINCEGFCLRQDINAGIISLNNLSSGLNLSTNKNLKISIDNREFLSIHASAEAEDPTDASTNDIIDAINLAFLISPYYNNTDNAQVKGSQRLGFSFADESTKPLNTSSETFLSRNSTYHFRVNGIQYSFNTTFEQGGPSYQELRDFIREALSFEIKGNFQNQQNFVEISAGNELIHFIKKGMTLSPKDASDTSVLNVPLRVNNVNFKNERIILEIDDNASPSQRPQRTVSDYEIKIYPFDVEIIDIGGSNYDIEITNSIEEPVGPVWIQQAQDVPDYENLLYQIEQEMTITPEAFVVSTGAYGNQELGFKIPMVETRGFQAFGELDLAPPLGSDRNFILTLDEDAAFQVSYTYNSNSLQELRDEIQAAIDAVRPGRTVVEIDEYGRIRVTSLALGSTSQIIIEDAVDGTLLQYFLGGVEAPVVGLDNQEIGLDVGTYSFVVNNYKYDISLNSNELFYSATPGQGFFNKLSDLLTPHGYLVELIEEEWKDEIKVTFETGERVFFEDENLFGAIEGISYLNQYLVETDWSWTGFGTPIGGGDYAYVARSYEEVLADIIDERMSLFSPSIAMSSKITLEGVNEGASNSIFSVSAPIGQEISAYGYTKATIVINEASANYTYGNIIYEIGTLNFWGKETKRFFYNYLFNQRDDVVVGNYNTENFDTEDPSYREPAKRIYNTHYNDITKEIDFSTSRFVTKFTRNETQQLSVFSIQDDWQLDQSIAANVSSIPEPNLYLNDQNYLININIDNMGFVTIDLTGDTGDFGEYDINGIIERINVSIRENFQYSDNPLYSSFRFAVEDNVNDTIVIRSPLNSGQSKITIIEPGNTSVQATDAFFGLAEIAGYEYDYFANGDYYIDINKIPFTGDFVFGSNVIRNVTGDFSLIKRGDRVLQVPGGVVLSSYIARVDDALNEIVISNQAGATQSGQSFNATDDLMVLHRLGEESNFPDLEFNFHFVNDRRFVEDSFDGRIITVGEGVETEQIETLGFPLGSLDEDVYDAFLQDKKVVGVNHVFKQSRFTTFDIAGIVFYESSFSRVDVAQRVEESLRRAFSLDNRDYGEIVPRSRIMNIIHQNAGVDYVQIDYLGIDYTRQAETNVGNSINPRFDEIITISENRFSGGRQVSGILFDYRISGV